MVACTWNIILEMWKFQAGNLLIGSQEICILAFCFMQQDVGQLRDKVPSVLNVIMIEIEMLR